MKLITNTKTTQFMQSDSLPSSLIPLADCSEGTLAGINEDEVVSWVSAVEITDNSYTRMMVVVTLQTISKAVQTN